MSLIRTRRLQHEEQEIEAFLRAGGRRLVDVLEKSGRPPCQWRLVLKAPGVMGLQRACSSKLPGRQEGPFRVADRHEVEVFFQERFPFEPPHVRFKTPIFHPNVFADGRLCWGVGASPTWWNGGEGFALLIQRILDILVGMPACVNFQSPANSLAVEPYRRHTALFPLAKLLFPQQPQLKQRISIRSIAP